MPAACCNRSSRKWGRDDRDRARGGDGSRRDRTDVATLTKVLREGGDVITVPAGVRVRVATKPVDFRRGADSLAALAKEELRRDPFSGTIFVFRSKRADRLKILAC
jgi:transposase